jgi:hypothetical protein
MSLPRPNCRPSAPDSTWPKATPAERGISLVGAAFSRRQAILYSTSTTYFGCGDPGDRATHRPYDRTIHAGAGYGGDNVPSDYKFKVYKLGELPPAPDVRKGPATVEVHGGGDRALHYDATQRINALSRLAAEKLP